MPRSECQRTPRRVRIGAQIGPVSEANLSVLGPRLERMFEPEAGVADWERTGRVPVPAALLAAPDLTEQLAAGPPLVDELTDSELLARSERGDCGADAEGIADGDRAPHAREGGADAPGWVGVAPGVVLASVLTTVDLSRLTEFDLVEAVAGWERLTGWMAAEQTRVVAELSGRPLFGRLSSFRDGIDPVSAVGMEISARLRISHREADARVVFAQELTGPRRATFDAFARWRH